MDKVISTQFSKVRTALFKKQETALKLKSIEEKVTRAKATALQRFKKSFSAFLFSHNVTGENAENLSHSFDSTMINLVDKALTSQLETAKANANAAVDRYTQVLLEAKNAIIADVPERFSTLLQRSLFTFNDKVLKLEFDILINERERVKASVAKSLITPITSSASTNDMELDNSPSTIQSTTTSTCSRSNSRSNSRGNNQSNNKRPSLSISNRTQVKSGKNNYQQKQRGNSKQTKQQQQSKQPINPCSTSSNNRNKSNPNPIHNNKNKNDWILVDRNSKNKFNRAKNNINNNNNKNQQNKKTDSKKGNSKISNRSNKSSKN